MPSLYDVLTVDELGEKIDEYDKKIKERGIRHGQVLTRADFVLLSERDDAMCTHNRKTGNKYG